MFGEKCRRELSVSSLVAGAFGKLEDPKSNKKLKGVETKYSAEIKIGYIANLS